MKISEISIDEAFNLPKVLFVDVRSPGEYAEATIPTAINIPILDDEERKIVGTVYKEQSPAEAKKLGMTFVSPKLPQIIEKFSRLAENHQVVVLCWRGGMRSLTISLVLNLMGLPVYRLIGGYKAYRQYVLNFLSQTKLPQEAIVLHGLTGVGKTEVLTQLYKKGLPVLDLEGLACNRGSVFGWIGQCKPPSQKAFESLILEKFREFKGFKYFFVECESKKVGKLFLPSLLIKEMNLGKHVLLYDTLENRVARLVKDYAYKIENDDLIKIFKLLTDTLGKNKVQELEQLVKENNYEAVAEILLCDYYDPLYKYPSGQDQHFNFCVDTSNMENATEELMRFFSSLN